MTKRAAAVVAFGALALCSCTRTVQDRGVRVSAPPQPTGVRSTMMRQVLNAVDAGEGDVRVRELRARLISHPDDLDTRLTLARHYANAGFPEIAIEHYRLASSRWPDDENVAVLLVRALYSTGATGAARLHMDHFLAGHPDSGPDAYSWAGILQDATADYPAGERSHRTAIGKREESSPLHNNLGYNLLLQARHEEAAVEFRRALAIQPDSAIARSNLGIALAEHPTEALKAFASVTDAATAHNNLGAVLMERGDVEGARRELERALGYNNHHPAALSNLQLVAEIGGGGVSLPAAGSASAWRRFVRTLGVVLLGTDTESKTNTSPASAAGKFPAAPQGVAAN